MIIAIVGIILGVLIGFYIPIDISFLNYSIYIAIIILSCMDSIFGGMKATIRGTFNLDIFLSGFVGNMVLAVFLTYIGERLGVPLYYAAIFAFGLRIFNNFSVIRRLIFNKE